MFIKCGTINSTHWTALFAAATCKGVCQLRSLILTSALWRNKTSTTLWFPEQQALYKGVNHFLSLAFTAAPFNRSASTIAGSPLYAAACNKDRCSLSCQFGSSFLANNARTSSTSPKNMACSKGDCKNITFYLKKY